MLKKRVIFTLLYDSGNFMLSRNFRLQKVGDLKWLRKNYNFSHIAFSIDELVILDVTRGERDFEQFCEHVTALTEDCFVPIAAGGGITTIEQATRLLRSGADKIVVNSLLKNAPEEVNKIAGKFGKQCIVASLDVKRDESDEYHCYIHNGDEKINRPAVEFLSEVTQLPVGEIYINSMDRDGTGHGYDEQLLDLLGDNVDQPVILAGGAGKPLHFSEGLKNEKVDAVATAHLFNFVGTGLEKSRQNLLTEGFHLSQWDKSILKSLKGKFA